LPAQALPAQQLVQQLVQLPAQQLVQLPEELWTQALPRRAGCLYAQQQRSQAWPRGATTPDPALLR
jgi:hypothetical protein